MWNIDSGKVVDVYKFGQKHRFEEMLLSGDGKMAACSQVSRTLGIEHKEKTLPLIVFNTTSLEHKEITLEDEQLGLYNAKMDYFGRYFCCCVWFPVPRLDVLIRTLKLKYAQV